MEIKMPSLSPTMTHGTLVKWRVREGAAVARGEIIAEIETDKTVLEIESPGAGVLTRRLHEEGAEEIPVGAAIAELAAELEDGAAAATPVAAASGEASPPREQPAATGRDRPAPNAAANLAASRPAASPAARALARQHHIALATLSGSGPGGRIVRQDVERLLAGREQAADGGRFQDIPLSGVRKSIARRLQASKRDIPHYRLTVEAEVDALLSTRQTMNSKRDAADKISVNDLIVKACALSLRERPAANAHFVDGAVRRFDTIDIAIATALDDGLVTPVLRQADALTAREIARATKELVRKARAGNLPPEQYQSGTFTISNLGMFQVSRFDAIINPPQVAILAVGAAERKPLARGDSIVAATMTTLTLSCDHRVLDGREGAELLAAIKRRLENPAEWVGADDAAGRAAV